jgi:hemerythrin
MAIHWEENLKLGVPLIDEQHEEIFAHFAKLSETLQEGKGSEEVIALLNYLNNYAKTHFSDEENLMLLYKYDGLEEQRQQHILFKENIIKFMELLASTDPTQEIAIKIDATLIRYFINHIRRLDTLRRKMVNSSCASPSILLIMH